MSKRKPSIATQLKDAKVELAAAQQKIGKLEKDLESEKANRTYASAARDEAQKEVTQIHEFLNAIPNPPADKGADGYTKISAMTRLSVFLATRQ